MIDASLLLFNIPSSAICYIAPHRRLWGSGRGGGKSRHLNSSHDGNSVMQLVMCLVVPFPFNKHYFKHAKIQSIQGPVLVGHSHT